jgi:uncharacterized protein (DUF2235 family)
MPNEPRNLVVCCDGTSNEIGRLLSNVLKLYRIAEKSDEQLTFYQPGIGTIAMPDSWGRWRQAFRSAFEMATGRGLDRDVLNAYLFLCRQYREGDRIFLFGFSRGAYTARVLAGLIYLIGLLREGQVNFAGYALKAYKKAKRSDNYQIAHDFSEVALPRCVAIHFVGLWDTVASVIVPGRLPLSKLRLEELPFTTSNPAVRTFRQALALDEFRRMFRAVPWEDGQIFQPNRFATPKTPTNQDNRSVWFAGCHSDVGGGFAEDQSSLSKFPLLWMLSEAAAHGLRVRTQMINHIVRGHRRAGARTYQGPDAKGPLHLSLKWYWRLIEWIPKNAKRREWPGRRTLFGYYVPWGEPRRPGARDDVHQSVLDRMKLVPGYAPVNVPPNPQVEPLRSAGPSRRAPAAVASGEPAPAPVAPTAASAERNPDR